MASATGFYVPKKQRLYQTGAKVRNVIVLIYLEDLEKAGKGYGDLIAYLDSLHCKAVVSPIHDRDHFTSKDVFDWCERHIDPETGDLDTHYLDSAPYVGKPKKPHVHVGIVSKSQRDAFGWSEYMSGLLDVRPSMWEKMEDFDGFTRYCAHLDSPDKARYSAFDIVGIAGVDLSCLLKTDKAERIQTLNELYTFIQDRNFKTFHALLNAVFMSGDMDMIESLRANSSMLYGYFSSKRWEAQDKKKKKEAENGGNAATET